MKELALYFLDIVKNSTAAGSSRVELSLTETADHTLTAVITDNGRGMSPEMLAAVSDPFTTTRTTRKVGMGIPLYRLAAEQTGGTIRLESQLGAGTRVTAIFHRDHVDCPPMGDLAETVAMVIQGSPDTDFVLIRSTPLGSYRFDTVEIREILGPDIPLDAPDIFLWIREHLTEQETKISPRAEAENPDI